MNEYPLYPKLSEAGEQEAQKYLDSFKEKMKKIADETMSEVYVNLMPYIETDSWGNFRNQIMEGFRNYDNRKIQNAWDFAEIRKEIFKQFHNEIIPELNQDLLKEIEELKATVKRQQETMQQMNRY